MMAVGHRQPGRMKEALSGRQKIAEAIAKRDGDNAERLVREHLSGSLNAYQQAQDEQQISQGLNTFPP